MSIVSEYDVVPNKRQAIMWNNDDPVYKRICASPCINGVLQQDASWWRYQMETFSAWQAIYAENSPVPGEFPGKRPVTRNFYVFFDLHLNKRLSKQWWGWWFETLSHPLWRHRNDARWQGYFHEWGIFVICVGFASISCTRVSPYEIDFWLRL